jgi:hypothetical protein
MLSETLFDKEMLSETLFDISKNVVWNVVWLFFQIPSPVLNLLILFIHFIGWKIKCIAPVHSLHWLLLIHRFTSLTMKMSLAFSIGGQYKIHCQYVIPTAGNYMPTTLHVWWYTPTTGPSQFTSYNKHFYSIIIHHHPSSSIIIHHHPSSTIIIHHHTSSSIIIHHHPSSSIIIHHHPSSSIIIHIIHHHPSSISSWSSFSEILAKNVIFVNIRKD